MTVGPIAQPDTFKGGLTPQLTTEHPAPFTHENPPGSQARPSPFKGGPTLRYRENVERHGMYARGWVPSQAWT